MNILHITFDLETCSLAPTAAIMSLGAVAWREDDETTPFFLSDGEMDFNSYFSVHIDLRRMFLDGFTFDQDTANWWAEQKDDAKKALLASDTEETPCSDIKVAISDFFAWIQQQKENYGAEEVYLWSQGSDFDIAILRNICHKYGIEIPVRYTNFRDHRTFYFEGARTICHVAKIEFDPKNAYKMVEEYNGKGAPHDPIYDCKRSINSTWQMMNHLRCLDEGLTV